MVVDNCCHTNGTHDGFAEAGIKKRRTLGCLKRPAHQIPFSSNRPESAEDGIKYILIPPYVKHSLILAEFGGSSTNLAGHPTRAASCSSFLLTINFFASAYHSS